MKTCQYCGLESDDAAMNCRECGVTFVREKPVTNRKESREMSPAGKFGLILLVLFGVVVVLPVLFIVTIGFLFFRLPDPPKAKLGYTGEWRNHHALGWEHRPLPPAAGVWHDYSSWTTKV